MSRHTIPIHEARAAYDVLGSWRDVAQVLRRSNGTQYQAQSIFAAVRNADKLLDPTNEVLRRENVRLHDRIHELESLLGLREEFPPEWRLGRLEALLLGLLMRRQLVSMETAQVALYELVDDASERGVKWALQRLRKAAIVPIQNTMGIGWFLTAKDKAALRKIVDTPVLSCEQHEETPGNPV